jgi:hypothetical protein
MHSSGTRGTTSAQIPQRHTQPKLSRLHLTHLTHDKTNAEGQSELFGAIDERESA